MADKAHRLTDEKLEEMEKRLSAIYSRAGKTGIADIDNNVWEPGVYGWTEVI